MQHSYLTLFILLIFWSCNTTPKHKPSNEYYALFNAIENHDSTQIEIIWDQIKNGHQPFIWNDSVAFIYRGNVKSVEWNGDFNRWGRDTSFNNQGERIAESDFWVLTAKFPSDARLDYKLVVDENWIIDPYNPNIQMTGAGGIQPNSELRMPGSIQSKWILDSAKEKGSLSEWTTLESSILDYSIQYKVYTPYGYNEDQSYETIYFLDGMEYTHPELGASIQILNNLIEQDKINPVIAVFIDTQDPNDPEVNRRMSQLALNNEYVEFISKELIPIIDASFSTQPIKKSRAIAGVSLGGLTATYAAAMSQSFGKVLIQSAAYWYKPEIYDIVKNDNEKPNKVSISTGTFYDSKDESLKMREMYNLNQDSIQYIQINEGHSWGNFKSVLADQLIYLLGK